MESNQGQAVYVNTPKVFGSGSGVNEDSAVNYEEITIQEEGQNQYEKLNINKNKNKVSRFSRIHFAITVCLAILLLAVAVSLVFVLTERKRNYVSGQDKTSFTTTAFVTFQSGEVPTSFVTFQSGEVPDNEDIPVATTAAPLKKFQCPKLHPPLHGTMDRCGNMIGNTCLFQCEDGYVIQNGSISRTCLEGNTWDGTQPKCTECPEDTYKVGMMKCEECPQNSSTQGKAGNMRKGCVCDKGYQGDPGGPCIDINECATDGGRGPCQDKCTNRVGTYWCHCSIPGYRLSKDKHTCEVDVQCKNLTVVDAPDNGGLVCHWYRQENSIQCAVRCNVGYEFPSRINTYETCSAFTAFQWSFRRGDKKAKIAHCIKEFFPGLRMESDVAYFTTSCASQSQNETNLVYNNFKKILDERNYCQRKPCISDTKDMKIICGRTA